MKRFFLRIIPYLISIIAGLAIYVCSGKYVSDSTLNDLNVNIAAGLLSIPLVFITYEFFSNLSLSNINKAVRGQMIFEINDINISIISSLRKLLSQNTPLTPEELPVFLQTDENNIRKNIVMTDDTGKALQTEKEKLLHILNSNNTGIFSAQDLQILFSVSNCLGIISKEIIYRDKIKDKKTLITTTHNLLQSLAEWTDLYQDELTAHHSFNIR
ncbi:hypothetical protein Dip518_001483 [Parelusimicrobium proximum]|uniref:hypothetical protein n=1 Tax=Parelusimicrobium proximum TaxID=3228953 RepID=UPI003D16F08C